MLCRLGPAQLCSPGGREESLPVCLTSPCDSRSNRGFREPQQSPPQEGHSGDRSSRGRCEPLSDKAGEERAYHTPPGVM
jgi:hypothetical protein